MNYDCQNSHDNQEQNRTRTMKNKLENRPWSKKEMRMRAGYKELAKAVIDQWILDGKPESDKKGIEYWFKVLQCEEK